MAGPFHHDVRGDAEGEGVDDEGAADASSLVDDVYQNGPNDRQVVGCCMVARTPACGKRCRKRSAAESRTLRHYFGKNPL